MNSGNRDTSYFRDEDDDYRPADGDDTGMTIPPDAADPPGSVLSCARVGRFAPTPQPEPFGEKMGRWSVICCALILPSFFCPVIVIVPILTGFGTGLTAVIVTRGRSIRGWIGLAVSGWLVGRATWAVITGR